MDATVRHVADSDAELFIDRRAVVAGSSGD
jgi:hypothetical protein